jgi:hypothetical protein
MCTQAGVQDILRETQLDDRVHDVAQARHIQRTRAALAQDAASTPHVAADHGLAEGETRCGLTGGDKLLVATLEARMTGGGELADRKLQGSCCAASDLAAKSCCESEQKPDSSAAQAKSRCCDEGVTAAAGDAEPVPVVAEGRPRQVTLRAMLACKGLVTSWLAVGGAPPTPRFEITGLLPPQAWVELLDESGEDPLLVPVPPPPKVA